MDKNSSFNQMMSQRTTEGEKRGRTHTRKRRTRKTGTGVRIAGVIIFLAAGLTAAYVYRAELGALAYELHNRVGYE